MPPDSPDYPRAENDPFDPELRRHDARAIGLSIYQGAPGNHRGILRLDDLALITWQEELDPTGATELDVPHASDFIRVEGDRGVYVLDVTLRKGVPEPRNLP